MTALAANRARHQRNIELKRRLAITGVDSDEFYEGALCNYSASASTVAPAADTSGQRFAGVCAKRLSTGSSNTHKVELEWGHSEWFPQSGLAAAQEGKNAVIGDDNTLTDAAAATNDVPCGMIEELETIDGTAGAWITVGVYAPSNA